MAGNKNNLFPIVRSLTTSVKSENQTEISRLENEFSQRLAQLFNEYTQKYEQLWEESRKQNQRQINALNQHQNNYNNPHQVTKTQIGLSDVDNTADIDKPISTAMRNALNGKANASHGVHVSYSSAAPKMNGTASIGSASTIARSDHVHPTDTSRAAASHTHTKSNITDFPASLPASDVYSWAKAAQKPGYTWNEIADKPSVFSPAAHSHEYLPLAGGTLTGDLRLKGSGNYGTKINLGDGDYVHLAEPSDDNLEIKAKNINFVVSGNITKNGSSLAGGAGTDYGTYRPRDIALFSYTPSSLGNGQIALVYT